MMQTPKFNPTALRMAKTLWSFGSSACNRVNEQTERHTDRQMHTMLYVLFMKPGNLCKFSKQTAEFCQPSSARYKISFSYWFTVTLYTGTSYQLPLIS